MNPLLLAIVLFAMLPLQAATIATFRTSVGSLELELYDEAKPITVSNFIKYATSGRYRNQFIHRWVPGFVIQGGGYRVDTSNPEQYEIAPVDVFGTIPNEARVSTNYSNVYGTIAMARVGGQINSATSQWFINLKDNGGPPANLDTVDEGYTVFGRVISGTGVLDLFVPEPPTNGIYISDSVIGPLAVLTTNSNIGFSDLVYVQVALRRDLDLQIGRGPAGSRRISWQSIAGVTNIVEFSTNLTDWVTFTNVPGSGQRIQVLDPSIDPRRTYRAKLLY